MAGTARRGKAMASLLSFELQKQTERKNIMPYYCDACGRKFMRPIKDSTCVVCSRSQILPKNHIIYMIRKAKIKASKDREIGTGIVDEKQQQESIPVLPTGLHDRYTPKSITSKNTRSEIYHDDGTYSQSVHDAQKAYEEVLSSMD